MSLAALQREFRAALGGETTTLALQVRETGRPPTAATRIGVYANAVQANQRGALAAVYPVVEQLVGTAFFNEAAARCLAAHPSTSGDLHDLGEEFPRFLREYSHAAELPYLGDLADLEWALHRAFHAADAAAVGTEVLASVPADALERLVLVLLPGSALIPSAWPILTLWRAHQPGASWPEGFSLDQGGETVMVHREGFECVARVVDPADAALVAASLAGQPLTAALADPAFAEAQDPGARLMAALGASFASGVVCGTRLADMVE